MPDICRLSKYPPLFTSTSVSNFVKHCFYRMLPHVRVKSKQTYKKVQMVLLLHSAFIRKFLLDRIQSAEILHDCHNVQLKNASSMMTAARNYIQCLSTSCVICRHVTKFCEKTFRMIGENYLKCLLLNYMVHVLHKLPHDRRRKAYRLSQMIKRSFQHTAFFLSIRRRPKMSS